MHGTMHMQGKGMPAPHLQQRSRAGRMLGLCVPPPAAPCTLHPSPCTFTLHPSPQSEALRAEVEGVKQDLGELEELREMRADVERKEKQQAAIIENQVGAQ